MHKKYAKIESNKVISLDWSKLRSTPIVSHDDPVLRKRVIRPQIRPFTAVNPVTEADSVTTIGNHRKVINLQVVGITEEQKRHHAEVLVEMCERLANCWNTINHITTEALYVLHEHYNWQCPKTGTYHHWRTPLTIEFVQPVWLGGKMTISNVRPVYNGFLPGQYRWIRPSALDNEVMVA